MPSSKPARRREQAEGEGPRQQQQRVDRRPGQRQEARGRGGEAEAVDGQPAGQCEGGRGGGVWDLKGKVRMFSGTVQLWAM